MESSASRHGSNSVEKMLSRKEAAQRLGVSPFTLDRMAARGEVRVHRVGRYPRYLWAELVEDTREESMSDERAVTKALRSVS